MSAGAAQIVRSGIEALIGADGPRLEALIADLRNAEAPRRAEEWRALRRQQEVLRRVLGLTRRNLRILERSRPRAGASTESPGRG